MRKVKLTKTEQQVEDHIEQYTPAGKEEVQNIARTIEARKKDAVLNIRINSRDLEGLKRKAAKLDVKYQTFISEILHKVAQA